MPLASLAWRAASVGSISTSDSRAAAVAFYALFSLAPMLVLVVAIAGFVLDTQVVSQQMLLSFGEYWGKGAAEGITFNGHRGTLVVVVRAGDHRLHRGDDGWSQRHVSELKSALNQILAISAPPPYRYQTDVGVLEGEAVVRRSGCGHRLPAHWLTGPGRLAVTGWQRCIVKAWRGYRWKSPIGVVVLALAFAVLLRVYPMSQYGAMRHWSAGLLHPALFSVGKEPSPTTLQPAPPTRLVPPACHSDSNGCSIRRRCSFYGAQIVRVMQLDRGQGTIGCSGQRRRRRRSRHHKRLRGERSGSRFKRASPGSSASAVPTPVEVEARRLLAGAMTLISATQQISVYSPVRTL